MSDGTLHFFDRTLMDEQTACGLLVAHLPRHEYTADPLNVDCRECHGDEEFLEVLGRAEYAPVPPGRLSWRQENGEGAEGPSSRFRGVDGPTIFPFADNE